ncbi:MAG: hypothetical protein LQ342_001203 [Letrouitia transgressa]|nr:MAG: hypothetical protein LQ342_001203 [Letrouitia transgressa]
METAIRWSSSSTLEEQQFLIADVNGRTFKHCRVKEAGGKELSHEILSTHHKVPAFRAFDWSPYDQALVAVGQWSGEATVIRLNEENAPALSLPIKHQRLCNAVTFGKPSLLATGLERVRNDFCLNIWDLTQRLLSSSSAASSSSRSSAEPVRKFASSEAITSIKFFPVQSDTFVAGVKGTCIRIYDLRESTGSASLQFPTTAVHNIQIDPLDENYFASAGTQKDTTIQIWDRRSGSSSLPPNLGVSQNQQGPVLEFKETFEASVNATQPNIWSLRYCKGRSGYLGALASTGDFKIFETRKGYSSEAHDVSEYETTFKQQHLSPTAQQLDIKRVHHIEHAYDHPRYRRAGKTRIVSFDFTNLAGPRGRPCAILLRGDQSTEIYELNGAPSAFSISPLAELVSCSALSRPKASPKLPLQRNGLSEAYVTRITPNGDRTIAQLSESLRHGLSLVSNGKSSANSTSANETKTQVPESKSSLLSCGAPREDIDLSDQDAKIDIRDALASFTLRRRRCTEGYLFDCAKNMEIVADDRALCAMWEWIGRAKQIATEGMMAEGLDLSYMGVYGIWNNDLGSERGARTLDKPPSSGNVSHATKTLCEQLELQDFATAESAYPTHRRLCLYLCGFGFPGEHLETTVNDFIGQNQTTKAAALAIIHNQPKLAFRALRSKSPSAALRELSLALAGFVKGNTDETWNETVQDIASSLHDPYARAILAFVRSGSWMDVLAETSLPLRDRLAVAIMYLSDVDLTTYIASTTHKCISDGDIEGIPFTGLTAQSIPLLQTYISRTYDLQSAILAIAHTCPRYFQSPLVALWREEYRSQLNTHRLFIQRVQFDVQATKLSVPVNSSKPLLAPPARQVSLRCAHCEQNLDRNPAHAAATVVPAAANSGAGAVGGEVTAAGVPQKLQMNQGSIFGDSRSGTVCPKCGRHMPRCVVCMLWLGMPDPHSKAGAAGNAAAVAGAADEPGRKRGRDLMREMCCVCRSCWHMSHVGHARDWFAKHKVCPVPGCGCRCSELDLGAGE